MSLTVFLDAGPLGLVTNPKRTSDTIAAACGVYDMEAAGHRFVAPAIADYEVRRELVRSGKTQGVARLDAVDAAETGRFLSLTDTALLRGANLWAKARNARSPTADSKALDADVLIAAQALDFDLPDSDFTITTVNVGHLALFAPADLWTNINPLVRKKAGIAAAFMERTRISPPVLMTEKATERDMVMSGKAITVRSAPTTILG